MDEMDYPTKLRLASYVTEPAIRQAIGRMRLGAGGAGLDAGCGIGAHSLWLAEAGGPTTSVVGLDLFADNLAAAVRLASESPFATQVRFLEGDLHRLPFGDRTFDWVWCADTLWPLPGLDTEDGLAELARVTKPGGLVALAYWSNQLLLSGYPELEARLGPAFVGAVPYLRDVPPAKQALRALGWARNLGLDRSGAHTFVADIQAPLSRKLREGLTYCLWMLWGGLKEQLTKDDWQALESLCDPKSGEFLLDRPDYYGFVTYTVFFAYVPS